jgi:hypothetical protein
MRSHLCPIPYCPPVLLVISLKFALSSHYQRTDGGIVIFFLLRYSFLGLVISQKRAILFLPLLLYSVFVLRVRYRPSIAKSRKVFAMLLTVLYILLALQIGEDDRLCVGQLIE